MVLIFTCWGCTMWYSRVLCPKGHSQCCSSSSEAVILYLSAQSYKLICVSSWNCSISSALILAFGLVWVNAYMDRDNYSWTLRHMCILFIVSTRSLDLSLMALMKKNFVVILPVPIPEEGIPKCNNQKNPETTSQQNKTKPWPTKQTKTQTTKNNETKLVKTTEYWIFSFPTGTFIGSNSFLEAPTTLCETQTVWKQCQGELSLGEIIWIDQNLYE